MCATECGIDLGLTHDATAVAIAHAETVLDADGQPTRRIVVDLVRTFHGSPGHPVSLAEVEATALALWRSYNRPRLRADPFQAAGLIQNLKAKGVAVEPWQYTATRYGEMASILFAAPAGPAHRPEPDDELLDELRNVRLVETIPGQLRIQHDVGRHDDQCVALGMAVVPLVRQGSGPVSLQVPDGMLPSSPILTRQKPSQEPPVPIVAEGEPRPTDKLVRFAVARRHRNFERPGPRWR